MTELTTISASIYCTSKSISSAKFITLFIFNGNEIDLWLWHEMKIYCFSIWLARQLFPKGFQLTSQRDPSPELTPCMNASWYWKNNKLNTLIICHFFSLRFAQHYTHVDLLENINQRAFARIDRRKLLSGSDRVCVYMRIECQFEINRRRLREAKRWFTSSDLFAFQIIDSRQTQSISILTSSQVGS